MKKLISFLIIWCIPIATKATTNDIVALVNNVPITNYDHQVRKKLIKIINNLGDLNSNQDTALSMAALESLVDEELILQYGKKANKVINEHQIQEALASIEQSNKMPKGGLLSFIMSKDGNIEDFRNKIKADIIKMGILSQIKDMIHISSNEINATILDGAHKDLTIDALVFISCDKNSDTYDKMTTLQRKLKTCDSVNDSWYENFATKQRINTKLNTLKSPLHAFMIDIEPNKTSSVFETPEGFKLILVCNKVMDPLTDKEKELVVDFLTNKKVNKQALKLFSDIKKNASIKRFKTY